MMSIECLGYIGIAAADLASWSNFGTQVLGMAQQETEDGNLRFRYDDQLWRIEVVPGDGDDIIFAGFEVSGPESLEAARNRLTEAGVKFIEGSTNLKIQRGVLDLIHCQDPQGMIVEIYYGPSMATELPFVSPAGVSSFVTGEQGMGHIFLQAQNIDELRGFYKNALGFKLTDIIEITPAPGVTADLEFYHCNPRHHTIGMAVAMTPKILHHFMLQGNSMNDVGFAYDRAEDSGTLIKATIGCHTNDQVVSFYVETPSGFDVEFGFGGVTIHEAWRTTRHVKPSSWGHKGLAGN